MKAILQDRYGPSDFLRVGELPVPQPREGQVRVRVRAASIHPDVWHVVTGHPYVLRLMGSGLRRPKNPIPGTDMAGVVDALGPGATRFRIGDPVFGETLRGFQWVNGGAFAEYVSVAEDILALKPPNVSFEEAAAVPSSGVIALHNLRVQGRLRSGQRVLINGAGGGVGTIALQIAKADGAHVTAVDHTAKLEALRALGADRVLDYTREDFTQLPDRYDLIFDVPGNHGLAACRRVLAEGGRYVLIGHDLSRGAGHRVLGSLPRFLGLAVRAAFTDQLPKFTATMAPKGELMEELRRLLETGKLTPRIHRTFPLGEAGAAIRALQEGAFVGKIVLTVP